MIKSNESDALDAANEAEIYQEANQTQRKEGHGFDGPTLTQVFNPSPDRSSE